MPNYCENEIKMYGNYKTRKKLCEFVKSGNNEFDFEKIIPMPADLFEGDLGQEEIEISGERNSSDWRIENWGTKWNSEDAHVDEDIISFLSAWEPPVPVVLRLSKLFPDITFVYRYFEGGNDFSGLMVINGGESALDFYGDYDMFGDPYWEDSDDIDAIEETSA